jgi:hypothetical protein
MNILVYHKRLNDSFDDIRAILYAGNGPIHKYPSAVDIPKYFKTLPYPSNQGLDFRKYSWDTEEPSPELYIHDTQHADFFVFFDDRWYSYEKFRKLYSTSGQSPRTPFSFVCSVPITHIHILKQGIIQQLGKNIYDSALLLVYLHEFTMTIDFYEEDFMKLTKKLMELRRMDIPAVANRRKSWKWLKHRTIKTSKDVQTRFSVYGHFKFIDNLSQGVPIKRLYGFAHHPKFLWWVFYKVDTDDDDDFDDPVHVWVLHTTDEKPNKGEIDEIVDGLGDYSKTSYLIQAEHFEMCILWFIFTLKYNYLVADVHRVYFTDKEQRTKLSYNVIKELQKSDLLPDPKR